MRLLRLLFVVLLAGPADAARVAVPVLKTGGPVVTQTAIPKLTVTGGLIQPALSLNSISQGTLNVLKTPKVELHDAKAETVVLGQMEALVESLPAPDAPAEQGSVSFSNFWSGSKLAAITEPEMSAAPGEAPGYSTLAPAEIDRAAKKLGKVPKPRVGLAKASAALYWGGLTALMTGLHLQSDRIAPLVLGVFLGGMMGLMAQFMIGSMSRVQQEEPRLPGKEIAVPEELRAEVARLAKSVGVPAPRAIHLMETEVVQAAVSGMTRGGYELHLTTKLMGKTSPEQLEAVLRHEFSHVRHYDGLSRTIQIWLAPVLSGVALTAGVIGVPDALIAPLFALPLLSFPFFMKLDEYHADQNAAATQGTAAPLAAFFIRDADDSKGAASALSGKAFSHLSGWRRAFRLAWSTASRFFLSHPEHELRVARLARLAAAPEGPAPIKTVAKGSTPTEWLINGKSVYEMGWGAFKRVVPHPEDPDYVVKLFVGFGDSMTEMRSDHARSKETIAAGVTPRITAAGALLFEGKPTGYIVQERVHDAVERQPDYALKNSLGKIGLKLQDAEPMILGKNVLYGRTLTGGARLWLVDPDVVPEVR